MAFPPPQPHQWQQVPTYPRGVTDALGLGLGVLVILGSIGCGSLLTLIWLFGAAMSTNVAGGPRSVTAFACPFLLASVLALVLGIAAVVKSRRIDPARPNVARILALAGVFVGILQFGIPYVFYKYAMDRNATVERERLRVNEH